MAIPKPITRVEQYLASIAGASDVTLPAYPITREEYYLASWAEKSGFEIAEVDGTPPLVLKDCIGEQFKGLVLYGKSTQVTTTGTQLLNLVDREPVTICGLTWQIKNQCIFVNGTATDEGNVTDFYICGAIGVYADVDFPEGEITISADLPKGIVMYVVKERGTTLTYIASNKKDGSFEHISGSKYRILLRAMKEGAIYDNVIKAMLNTGSTALPWEPYTGGKPSPSPDYPQKIVSAGDDGNVSIIVKNPDNEQMQSVSFSTPNGLHGIPVSANGNYTDSNGQQWVCDEVDLERGVKVQRVGAYKFYSSDGFTMDQAAPGLTRFYIVIGDTLSADTGTLTSSALCSALPLGARADTYGRINVFTIVGMRLYINIENITSANELQQYLQQTPMTLIALLATPIETPLSETDIAAYRALTTYKGTTILESECYLKVKYSKLRK